MHVAVCNDDEVDDADGGVSQPTGADEEPTHEGCGGCAAGGKVQGSEEVERTGESIPSQHPHLHLY